MPKIKEAKDELITVLDFMVLSFDKFRLFSQSMPPFESAYYIDSFVNWLINVYAICNLTSIFGRLSCSMLEYKIGVIRVIRGKKIPVVKNAF